MIVSLYPKNKRMNLEKLKSDIQEEVEWLGTSEGDEVECISIENLEGILSKHLGVTIKLSVDEDN